MSWFCSVSYCVLCSFFNQWPHCKDLGSQRIPRGRSLLIPDLKDLLLIQGPSSYLTSIKSPESEGLVCEEHKGISHFPAECQNHWTASSCLNHVNCCYFFFTFLSLIPCWKTRMVVMHTLDLWRKKTGLSLERSKTGCGGFLPTSNNCECVVCVSHLVSLLYIGPNLQ